MKPTDFAMTLQAYLRDYLPNQRNASPNTIKSYAMTFSLLARHFDDSLSVPPAGHVGFREDARHAPHVPAQQGHAPVTVWQPTRRDPVALGPRRRPNYRDVRPSRS